MCDVIYREATLEDIPQMLELWREFWPPQPYETNLERKISKDPDLVYVAEYNSRIVGTIIGGYDEWWAWIYRVAVHPSHQRKGIAKSLFHGIHKRLAARGADAACLIASPSNEPMCKLLKKLDYREKSDRRYSFVFGDENASL